MQNLKKERNELKKEQANLTKKLEKVEEYLRISKELSSNLQMEKYAHLFTRSHTYMLTYAI